MKRLFAAVMFAALGAYVGFAQASTVTTDITDMWWNPNESGWGVNVIQQSDVAFLTFFVYDKQSNPIWYTAAVQYQGVDANGSLVWTGDLVATSGPWFGGTFPPANVTRRVAGSATFTLTDINDAVLDYSVDGVAVTKAIQRETWAIENYSGSYLGGSSITLTNCNPSSMNGSQNFGGELSVNQSGTSITMTVVTDTIACTFTGVYSQAGKYGEDQGGYVCTDGTLGTFVADSMTPSINGFTARVSGHSQYCEWSGTLGGVTLQP